MARVVTRISLEELNEGIRDWKGGSTIIHKAEAEKGKEGMGFNLLSYILFLSCRILDSGKK